eukprot:9384851-Lingulodinium_polyedra.AAC.1
MTYTTRARRGPILKTALSARLGLRALPKDSVSTGSSVVRKAVGASKPTPPLGAEASGSVALERWRAPGCT